MANPREIAEQAFALLQNALSESEARASDLDDQLKRKRTPKNRIEEQADVLAHRLESVEAERTRWEQQAGHLEEIAEAERAKVAQLKKKLEIAESGPEKLTKKEVNFWRAKSETIDAQIKEYQERLTALRRELNERDSLIEKLEASSGTAQPAMPAEQPAGEASADAELHRQLEQRDRWLAELRLELHELRGQPAPPLETQAEVETLRSQIASLERALAEAHNMRTAAQADLERALAEAHNVRVTAQTDLDRGLAEAHNMRAAAQADLERGLAEADTVRAAAQADLARIEQEIAVQERAVREATAAAERARAVLTEREHRIAELAAEVEHLRNDLRQRDELQRQRDDRDRTVTAGHEEQVAALTRDAEALRGRMEQDRHDAGAARAALEIAFHEREQQLDKQRELLAANEHDFEELRRQLAEREQAAAGARHQAEEQRQTVQERERELADRQQQLHELSHAIAERDQRFAACAGELEQVRTSLAAQDHEIDNLREALQGAQRELEQARTTLTANERELASLRETLGGSSRELDELRAAKHHLEAALAGSAQDMDAAREQLAGLETELKEEREHAESLGELANERREHMTKLQEQVEEAEERYADANWRLGKSLHFERIVKRRKGLIQKLLDALRAKMKTNVALKAGLDGLRTFKQTAEMNQHKLLQRIDGLKAELKDAEETVKRHQGGTAAKEELTSAISRATALEERLNTQAELIQSLEADLKKARLSHKVGDDKHHELERLTKELEAKTELVTQLQADADEQQRKLSKLRGSESETVRLKALTEKDRSEIDELQREVTQLREELARQNSVAAASGNNAELEAKLKERENSLTRLMGTIKEHETAIKKLTESADSWKRKYQFLATDQPDAYKSTAEK